MLKLPFYVTQEKKNPQGKKTVNTALTADSLIQRQMEEHNWGNCFLDRDQICIV